MIPMRTTLLFLATLALPFLFSACSRQPYETGQKYIQLPWPNDNGTYSLQDVQVDTFSSPENLKGDLATIYIEPYLLETKLESGKPVGRFARLNGNVLVPADFDTLQASAVYAHHEKLFYIDKATGTAPHLKVPARIAIEALLQDGDTGALKNNALYDGELDALLIVPYTDNTLPISLNAGILAHEHFHAIFQAMVLNRLPLGRVACDWRVHLHTHDFKDVTPGTPTPLTPQEYNQFLVRGLNEGLADFWGWVYTGDSSFIGRSLEGANDRRRLDREPEELPDTKAIKEKLAKLPDTSARFSLSYALGTYYARLMKRLAEDIAGTGKPSLQERVAVAKALVESLPFLASTLEKSYKTEFISPNVLLKPLQRSLPQVQSASTCSLLKKVAAPEEGQKPVICEAAQ